MAKEYSLVPKRVPRVETAYRRIVTDFPVPESIPILQKLSAYEPLAMRGQPPVVWNRAEGFQVFDAWGNRWIDWSSGVLITNAGHGRREIADAIAAQAASGLLTNYCFPSEIRGRLAERISSLLPEPLKKVFLLTTGSETVECAIKLCRTYGVKAGGRKKHVIVSYDKAFHGRTLGAQQAGGIPALKEWIVNMDPGFVQVPFPDGFRTPDTSFALFEQSLREAGVEPQNVAGVMLETYQGGSAAFAPRGIHEGAAAVVHGPQGPAGLRRGAGRLRPHRNDVGLRALRHRAGPGHLRQGHLQLAAHFRRGRARGRDGPVPCRQHDLHPHRQPGVLRGGAGFDRSGGEGEPGGERAPHGRDSARAAAAT